MIKKKIETTVIDLGVYDIASGKVEKVKTITLHTLSAKMINAAIKNVEKMDNQRYIIMRNDGISETRCMTEEDFMKYSHVYSKDLQKVTK